MTSSQIEVAEYLVLDCGVDVHACDGAGETALSYVAAAPQQRRTPNVRLACSRLPPGGWLLGAGYGAHC